MAAADAEIARGIKIVGASINLITRSPIESYLQASPVIDFEAGNIQELLEPYRSKPCSEVELARSLFEFVRDEVPHSWDIRQHHVTMKASDVLLQRHGICYAKSHLLAALLRGMGIPSGICYQRLRLFDTPDSGYVVHGLNTVYLASLEKWIRLDARGNKPGVNAQFSTDNEQLAFPIREHLDERDYLVNCAEPHPATLEPLIACGDCLEMYVDHLPTELSE
jgi:transglutaminase-like putative cysteine protease